MLKLIVNHFKSMQKDHTPSLTKCTSTIFRCGRPRNIVNLFDKTKF